MDRRTFVASSIAAIGASVAAESAAIAQRRPAGGREFYELKTITFANAVARDRYSQFMKTAFVPAARRIGLGPVGSFTVEGKPEDLTLFVLTSSPSLESLVGVEHRLLSDSEYVNSGASVLDLPATDPPYAKVESALMLAFSGHSRMTLPKESSAGQARVFELRTYESHSKKANLKKIEMFNEGEIGIFERAGFQPVFFGETLVGPQVPNLTYMVTYPSKAESGQFWQKFLADPEKTRLFAIPEYADKLIVSKIRSTFLRPADWSQI